MNNPLAELVLATTRRAVELLLWLGPESYRDDIREQEGSSLSVSPLAGQNTDTELVKGMCVGPVKGPGLYHATLVLTCQGHEVEAHGQVTADTDGVHLIEASIYVDGKYVVRRNVSAERDGSLEPWGMPNHVSVTRPECSSVDCGECGLAVINMVQDGRYFKNVPHSSVVDTELVYGINPTNIARVVRVVHLADGRHEVKYNR